MAESVAERRLEKFLFHSRWFMAPMYAGLALSVLVLVYVFFRELISIFALFPDISQNQAILWILTLIDLSLAANLAAIVILSGYENFVSRLDIHNHRDVPHWFGLVDFSDLKLKLVASIVAISGIHLLKVFMDPRKTEADSVQAMIIIHLVFVVSGVLLAFMDWLAVKTKTAKQNSA